jgi:hypothetical protein
VDGTITLRDELNVKTTVQVTKGEYAWAQVDKRTNDWKERLDRQNVAMKGYWKHKMSVSEGSVTITNTYTGSRSDNWAKNGMSNSGTATGPLHRKPRSGPGTSCRSA